MTHCAVGLKTESGDSYTVLVEYRSLQDIPEYLHEILDEELVYVSDVQVDSGVDADMDDRIEKIIWEKIKDLEVE